MNDRLEREIDELLAQLGVDQASPAVRPAPRPPAHRWRRRFPGSPARLMLLGVLGLILALALAAPFIRPALYLGGATLAIGYLTWLGEPDPATPTEELGLLGRLYRWLYGEE